MGKYLILGFDNARLFANPSWSKDRSFDNVCGNTDRKNIPVDSEPITAGHVSNMLHVLFCQRPKSRNRFSIYDRVGKYDDMSTSSLIRYTSSIREDKDGLRKYPTQCMQMQKAMYNSHSRPVVTWNIMLEYLGRELFDVLCNAFDSVGVRKDTHTMEEAVRVVDLSSQEVAVVLALLVKNQRTAAEKYITSRGTNQTMTGNPQCRHTEVKSVDMVTSVSGQLAVLMDESDVEQLRVSCGCPTILDGGLVYVVGVVDAGVFSSGSYTPEFVPVCKSI